LLCPFVIFLIIYKYMIKNKMWPNDSNVLV
jgi:hypothetical protein